MFVQVFRKYCSACSREVRYLPPTPLPRFYKRNSAFYFLCILNKLAVLANPSLKKEIIAWLAVSRIAGRFCCSCWEKFARTKELPAAVVNGSDFSGLIPIRKRVNALVPNDWIMDCTPLCPAEPESKERRMVPKGRSRSS